MQFGSHRSTLVRIVLFKGSSKLLVFDVTTIDCGVKNEKLKNNTRQKETNRLF